METPRYVPTNRVAEHFANMVNAEARAAAAKTKRDRKTACKANVGFVLVSMNWTPEYVLERYSETDKKKRRGMEELLAEGHGVETHALKFFAELADIDPPERLWSVNFPANWKPNPNKLANPPAAKATDPNDLEAEMARAVLETAIKRGKAKLVRRIIETLVD